MTCVVGIDPGLYGAVAVWQDGAFRKIMPTFSVPVAKGKRDYDVQAMWQALIHLPHGCLVSLERQWAQVRQTPTGPRREGATQSFRLGYGYGLWYGLVMASGHRLHPVAPITWKRHFGLLKLGKKAGLLKLNERQACPDGAVLTDGTIDAMLLALYLVERLNNGGTYERNVTAART